MIAKNINKLCIRYLLVRYNHAWQLLDVLSFHGLLPTMNFQLTQLSVTVGTGRVKIDAPFFLFNRFNSII